MGNATLYTVKEGRTSHRGSNLATFETRVGMFGNEDLSERNYMSDKYYLKHEMESQLSKKITNRTDIRWMGTSATAASVQSGIAES
jgi:hypothetical protein